MMRLMIEDDEAHDNIYYVTYMYRVNLLNLRFNSRKTKASHEAKYYSYFYHVKPKDERKAALRYAINQWTASFDELTQLRR